MANTYFYPIERNHKVRNTFFEALASAGIAVALHALRYSTARHNIDVGFGIFAGIKVVRRLFLDDTATHYEKLGDNAEGKAKLSFYKTAISVLKTQALEAKVRIVEGNVATEGKKYAEAIEKFKDAGLILKELQNVDDIRTLWKKGQDAAYKAKSDGLLQAGEEHFKEKRYDDAEQSFRDSLGVLKGLNNPEWAKFIDDRQAKIAKALYWQARTLENQEYDKPNAAKRTSAIEKIKLALTELSYVQQPTNEANILKGQILGRLDTLCDRHDKDQAIAALESVIKILGVDSNSLWRNIGKIHEEKKEYAAAIEAYRKFKKDKYLNARIAKVLELKAGALSNEGFKNADPAKFSSAIECLEKALKLGGDPKLEDKIVEYLGHQCGYEPGKALAGCKKVLSIVKEEKCKARVRFQMARIYIDQTDYDCAIQYLKDAKKVLKDEVTDELAWALKEKAAQLRERGEYLSSVALLKEAYEMLRQDDPVSRALFLGELALLQQAQDQLEMAAKTLVGAIKLVGDHDYTKAELQVQLAEVKASQGLHQYALQLNKKAWDCLHGDFVDDAKQIKKKMAGNANELIKKGDGLAKQGKLKEAYQVYKRASNSLTQKNPDLQIKICDLVIKVCLKQLNELVKKRAQMPNLEYDYESSSKKYLGFVEIPEKERTAAFKAFLTQKKQDMEQAQKKLQVARKECRALEYSIGKFEALVVEEQKGKKNVKLEGKLGDFYKGFYTQKRQMLDGVAGRYYEFRKDHTTKQNKFLRLKEGNEDRAPLAHELRRVSGRMLAYKKLRICLEGDIQHLWKSAFTHYSRSVDVDAKIGDLHFMDRQYAKARAYYRKAKLDVRIKDCERNIAYKLMKDAERMMRNSQFDPALRKCREAVPHLKAAGENEHVAQVIAEKVLLAEAKHWIDRGKTQKNLNDPQAASCNYKQAYRVLKKLKKSAAAVLTDDKGSHSKVLCECYTLMLPLVKGQEKVQTLGFLAEQQAKLGKNREAYSSYEQAAKLNQDKASLSQVIFYYQMGRLHSKVNQPERALGYYRKAQGILQKRPAQEKKRYMVTLDKAISSLNLTPAGRGRGGQGQGSR